MAILTRTEKMRRYATWIEDSEVALHELALSGRAVTVRYGEKEVQFGPNDEKKLRDYIAYLRKNCGQRNVLRIVPN